MEEKSKERNKTFASPRHKWLLIKMDQKYCGRAWTGLIWFRTGTLGRLLWTR
jgi:hypothetical protein